MLAGLANFHGARAGRPLVLLRQIIIKMVDPNRKMVLSGAMAEVRGGVLGAAPWLTGIYLEGDELYSRRITQQQNTGGVIAE